MDLKLISSPAFHPHFLITQPPTRPTPASRYHATFTLPDAIFVDRDELIDLWSQSGHIEWDLKPTKIDIERPVRAGVQASVLRLSWSGDETLDLPLHARYLRPNEDASEVITLFQEGDVVSGWNCNGLNDTSCLGIVHHTPLSITLPAGRTSDRSIVELATPMIIWLGWIYLVMKIWRLGARYRHVKTD